MQIPLDKIILANLLILIRLNGKISTARLTFILFHFYFLSLTIFFPFFLSLEMCTPGQEQTKQKQRGKGVGGGRVARCKEVAVSKDSTASFT